MLYCISTSFYLVFSFLSTAASKRCAVVLVWDAGAPVQYQVPVNVITFHFWMLVIHSSILFYYLIHVGRYEKQWSGPLRSDPYTCTNSTQFPDDLYRYNLFFLLQHKQNQLNIMMIIINVKTMYCTLSLSSSQAKFNWTEPIATELAWLFTQRVNALMPLIAQSFINTS